MKDVKDDKSRFRHLLVIIAMTLVLNVVVHELAMASFVFVTLKEAGRLDVFGKVFLVFVPIANVVALISLLQLASKDWKRFRLILKYPQKNLLFLTWVVLTLVQALFVWLPLDMSVEYLVGDLHSQLLRILFVVVGVFFLWALRWIILLSSLLTYFHYKRLKEK